MLLETKNPQTEALFEDGVDYVGFSTKEEMLEKIKYYLTHEKERKCIAESGRRKVLNQYNTKVFWDTVFNNKEFVKNESCYLNTNLKSF